MHFHQRISHAFCGVIIFFGLASVGHAGQSIDVSLQASFASPPLLLELLETAAEENSTAYFPILDRIAEGVFLRANTDEEIYNRFINLLGDDNHITDATTLSSFKLALSLHSAAPRIAAHYQSYNTSVSHSRDCKQWLYGEGNQICDVDLDYGLSSGADEASNKVPATVPSDLKFDRRRTCREPTPSWILYVDVTDESFGPFFAEIQKRLDECLVGSITVRYRPAKTSQGESVPLAVSGFGVEMSLKRTDYIVIDDRESEDTAKEEVEAENTGAQAIIPDESDEQVSDLKPLSSSELTKLGMKTGSFIASSENPFETLEKLSQDFPKYSALLAAHNVSKEFSTEFYKNRQAFLPPGYNKIWINGLEISRREMEPFALLEHLRKEKRFIQRLQSIGFTTAEAIKLLSHPAISESISGDEVHRFDWRDNIEGQGTVLWLNDIEKDSRYESWPSAIGALLQRTYPGQLPTVRRNMHHLVMPIDLSRPEDVEIVVEVFQTLIKRTVPVRFGLVPQSNSEVAVKQAKIVKHLMQSYGIGAMLSYLENALTRKSLSKPSKFGFENTTKERVLRRDQVAISYADLFASSATTEYMDRARAYLRRLGLTGPDAPILVNGAPIARSEQWISYMSQRVTADLQSLQQGVFEEKFTDESWLPDHFLATASTRRNPLIVPEDDSSLQFVDVDQLATSHQQSYNSMPKIKASDISEKSQMGQLVIISDFLKGSGVHLLRDAADFLKNAPGVELSIIFHPEKDFTSASGGSPSFTYESEANQKLNLDDLSRIIDIYSNKESQIAGTKVDIEGIDRIGAMADLIAAIDLKNEEDGILLNGRLVRLPRGTPFTSEDFQTLFDYENMKRTKPVLKAADRMGFVDKLTDPLSLAKLVSLVSLSITPDTPEGIYESSPPTRTDQYVSWETKHSGIIIGDPKSATFQVVVALDPASQTAQRWVPILKMLSEIAGASLKISLNPVERLSELPIKAFYRQVLASEISFGANGEVLPPSANFAALPKDALLTMAMEVPPAWLVVPKHSIHDLDNIKLSSIKDGSDIKAQYELEHILIEGHSREVPSGQPPRGAKLVLGTDKEPHFADTIIMANLGYFQFKANPGVWKLNLQAGKTKQIFNLDSAGTRGYKARVGDESPEIVLLSFQGKTVFPRLSRKPGKENEDVLESADSARSGNPMDFVAKGVKLASEALSNIGLKQGEVQEAHADINIFSVASGHLYERMLNIMMVSVMRHTKHTVKFWFIENFLSPSFKDFIPTLAEEYGFKYELVTYKWPHWLRAQSEKQREIWGYKILFLDVLFPLSLKKVIFVDADQIVRTDMYDLVEHDLEGAPYGFTPMCDSRTSMEGFRFWKQGYWANFLKGRPYHISALYVVDLVKFRAIAAGDRLRQQYHQLSADPGSLSNLDQDLPNHMQHMLPIHSLPQSWLWCETWCSDEELADARTIDLCNNPQTKEPKLDRARRQVPEWTEYDNEIDKLRKKNNDPIVSDTTRNTKSRGHTEQSRKTAPAVKDEL